MTVLDGSDGMDGPAHLLRKAVADPWIVVSPDRPDPQKLPILKWFECVREGAPLWAFNRWSFKGLRDDDLPSAYPLSRILAQISEDEGVDPQRMWQVGSRDPLHAHLFSRRVKLPEGIVPLITYYEAGNPEWWFDSTSGQSFPWLDSFEDHPEESEVFKVGMDLVGLIERYVGASSTGARAKAKEDLDRFLDSISASLDGGRPARGAPDPILRAMFEQGKWLVGTAWKGLTGAFPSEQTARILSSRGVESANHRSWAIRLALPMFSKVEVLRMQDWMTHPVNRRAASHTPPRRFTVFMLAHRLGVKATSLAPRLEPRSDRHWFVDHQHQDPFRDAR